jgi:hypothetical protein
MWMHGLPSPAIGDGKRFRRERLEALLDACPPRIRTSEWPENFDMSVDDPVERIRRRYNSGQCGVCAAALHERTGGPVCGL